MPSLSSTSSSIRLLAGPAARERIARDGLRPHDIAAVAAAAGGPKGLALLPLDRFVFGHWLRAAPRARLLAGASIGAWRMAACAQRDPLPALARLESAYLELQRYPARPTASLVSEVCRRVVRELLGNDAARFALDLDPDRALHVITARARRDTAALRSSFARAALANAIGRDRLGTHLQRVVFRTGTCASPLAAEDRFATRELPLTEANLEDALLASGSIPLVADPVRGIDGAPAGAYWDGGLIDYHLYWRWSAIDGLVLYPHFAPTVTAGWLDKLLPWRRHGVGPHGRDWLANLLLVVPAPRLLARLPGRKLPDRDDFHRHGLAHDARLADWRRAIAECARMAEDFARFVERPDPSLLEPLP